MTEEVTIEGTIYLEEQDGSSTVYVIKSTVKVKNDFEKALCRNFIFYKNLDGTIQIIYEDTTTKIIYEDGIICETDLHGNTSITDPRTLLGEEEIIDEYDSE